MSDKTDSRFLKVKCNDCGAIFAATRNVVDSGKIND